MNSDLGYLPQYVDKQGISYYNKNTALCNATSYSIELLGPGKTDIDFTPVINMTEDEKYGRVTEDYRDATKMSAFNDQSIVIPKNYRYATYTFDLSSVYVNGLVSSMVNADDSDAKKEEARARAEEIWKDLI